MKAFLTRSLVLVSLLLAVPAVAEDAAAARAHYTRGTTLFDLGRYLEAAKEYEASFELKDAPALLFNIAQAYRLGHDYPEAIRAYKSFLRRKPDSDQRPQVEAHLRALQQLIDQPTPSSAPPPSPSAAVTPVTTSAATTTTGAPSDRAERTPLYKRWWLWTIVGVVVLGGAAVGVTLGVLASRDSFHPSLGKLGPAALSLSF